jgi:hypothetical protein
MEVARLFTPLSLPLRHWAAAAGISHQILTWAIAPLEKVACRPGKPARFLTFS